MKYIAKYACYFSSVFPFIYGVILKDDVSILVSIYIILCGISMNWEE